MSDLSSSPTSSYLDFNALGRLKAEASRDPSKAIRQTAEQFEAYFIQQMMKTMRESVEKSDLVDTGNADMYQDLMDKEVSMHMVKRGGIGLANMMERQMLQAQELSTQDALQMRAKPTQAFPLNPIQEPLPIKPASVEAYKIKNASKYNLGDSP